MSDSEGLGESEMAEQWLTVMENEREYRVVYGQDMQDWVAKFEKSWPEAKNWAHNMADTYNRRVKQCS